MKVKIRGLVFAGFAAAVFAQSAMAVDTDDKTVTSKTYVDAKFQAQAKRVEIGNGTGQYASVSAIPETVKTNEYYPSMKVLSDTVLDGNFQRKLTENERGPHVGIMINNGTEQAPDWQSEWQEIGGSTYVSVGSNTGGTAISVGLNDGKIANAAAVIAGSGQGPASTDEDDLTTAKAVYDFVSAYAGDTYQPKVDSDGLKVGVRTGDATNGYNSTWYTIKAGHRNLDANNQPSEVVTPRYVEFSQLNGSVSVDLYDNQIIKSDGANNGVIDSNVGNALATGIAVYNYAVPKQWSSQDEGKHLVIDSTGAVVLSTNTNPDIPVPTDSRCAQAGGTHVCALVAYWDATLNDNAGGVKYEWTVMAPTE